MFFFLLFAFRFAMSSWTNTHVLKFIARSWLLVLLFSALYSYNCSNRSRKQHSMIRGQEILYQIHTAFVVVRPSNSYIRHYRPGYTVRRRDSSSGRPSSSAGCTTVSEHISPSSVPSSFSMTDTDYFIIACNPSLSTLSVQMLEFLLITVSLLGPKVTELSLVVGISY